VKKAKARTGITDLCLVLKHIHLSEVYNAGEAAKAASLAFSFHISICSRATYSVRRQMNHIVKQPVNATSG
jgi:hypothetical protein